MMCVMSGKQREQWAHAANLNSQHERDHFVEVLREHQRKRNAERRELMLTILDDFWRDANAIRY